MALIGLAEAARLSGRNRATIHRAMKSGKLAYTLADGGERKIDISELERVFGTKATIGNGAQPLQSDDSQRREVETLREFLTESRAAVADLRRRLDTSEDERRRLTLLLSPPTSPAPDQPRPLGRRILAWIVKQHV
jgi:hypothetical protein